MLAPWNLIIKSMCSSYIILKDSEINFWWNLCWLVKNEILVGGLSVFYYIVSCLYVRWDDGWFILWFWVVSSKIWGDDSWILCLSGSLDYYPVSSP